MHTQGGKLPPLTAWPLREPSYSWRSRPHSNSNWTPSGYVKVLVSTVRVRCHPSRQVAAAPAIDSEPSPASVNIRRPS